MKTILFIDGRNFLDKIRSVIDPEKKKEIDFCLFSFLDPETSSG
jgi:hypothetical protein